MGKCSVCGNKIQYNQYKKIDGIIYCLDCIGYASKEEEPCKTLAEVMQANKEAEEERAEVEAEVKAFTDKKLTEALGEPMNMTIVKSNTPVCKFCGAKNSSDWLKLDDGTWCCKRRSCRSKLRDNEA